MWVVVVRPMRCFEGCFFSPNFHHSDYFCRFLSQISVNAYKEYLCHTELEQSQAGDKPTALNIQSTVSESRQRCERTALSRSCLLHCILGCLLIPNKYIHFSVSLSTRSAISFTNKTAMYLFLVNKFDT